MATRKKKVKAKWSVKGGGKDNAKSYKAWGKGKRIEAYTFGEAQRSKKWP